MNVLEYEAKRLLIDSGLSVPASRTVAVDKPLVGQPNLPVVVKSQVPVGGRGKAGGVRLVERSDELAEVMEQVSLLEIKGYLPQTLLLEEKLAITKEHYLSLLINRETASIQLMIHPHGGVEVEENAGGFLTTDITLRTIDNVAARVAVVYGERHVDKITTLLKKLFNCFVKNDATLIEINPLVVTDAGDYVCADAKIELDDAAAFRHPEWQFESRPEEANFVTLAAEGDVATIANGAGLAMATVDAVAAYEMRPANFLDVGGGASKESVLAAFERIMKFPHIKAIVINIFAGITRCDEVAQAIIAARLEITDLPPLTIRLSGTNYEEAVKLLAAEQITVLQTLDECLRATKEIVDAK